MEGQWKLLEYLLLRKSTNGFFNLEMVFLVGKLMKFAALEKGRISIFKIFKLIGEIFNKSVAKMFSP